MAMPPSSPGSYQSLLWEGLSPEQQYQRRLAAAKSRGDASGDLSEYQRMLWEGLSTEQRNKRQLEAAQSKYRASDAYFTDMFGDSPRGLSAAKHEISERKRRLASQAPPGA